MKGGRKVGEGSFGCVVQPVITCPNGKIKIDSKNKNKYISKLSKNEEKYKEDREHEIKLYEEIKKLPTYSLYFIILLDSCKFNKTEFLNKRNNLTNNINIKIQNEKEKCLIDKNYDYINDIYEFAGNDINNILRDDKLKSDNKLFKKQYKQVFYHMLDGLKNLHNLNIVHRDIKKDNMVILNQNNKLLPRYIDFGLSNNLLEIKNMNDIYNISISGTPGYTSDDLVLIYYLNNYLYNRLDIFDSDVQYQLYNEFINDENYKDDYGYMLEDYILSFDEFNKLLQEILKDLKYDDELFNYYIRKNTGLLCKGDVFSLGITFNKILKELQIIDKDMKDLIKKMTLISPKKRLTVQQCMNHKVFKNGFKPFKYNMLSSSNNKKTKKLKRPNLNKKQAKLKKITKKNMKVNKLKNIKMKGGERLGSGGYGCVVKPLINCPNKSFSKSKYVSKIEVKTEKNTSKKYDETYISNEIKKLKQYKKYFIINELECDVNLNSLLNRKPKDFMKVVLVEDKDKKYEITNELVKNKFSNEDAKNLFCPVDVSKKYKNVIMLNGGPTLKYYLDKNAELIKFNYVKLFHHLLTGIKKLHSKNIIHRDIKPANILGTLNGNKLTLRYIDYGLCDVIKSLKNKYNNNENYINFKGTKFYKPIDIYVLRKMLDYYNSGYDLKHFDTFKTIIKNTLNTDDYKKINSNAKNIALNKSFITLSSDSFNLHDDEFISINDLKNIYKSYLTYFINNNIFQTYTKKYNGIVFKTDIYALGIIFKSIQFKLKINNPQLNDLLKYMLQINPKYRYNILDCLQHPLFQNL